MSICSLKYSRQLNIQQLTGYIVARGVHPIEILEDNQSAIRF